MIKISDEMNHILTIVANEGSTKRQRQREYVISHQTEYHTTGRIQE